MQSPIAMRTHLTLFGNFNQNPSGLYACTMCTSNLYSGDIPKSYCVFDRHFVSMLKGSNAFHII